MAKRENAFVEAMKFLKKRNEELVQEQELKAQKKAKEEDEFYKRYYSIKENRVLAEKERANILENCKNNNLAVAIKAIYITALEASTLTDEAIILAESLVDNWIKESGGASKIMRECNNKTYLLSRICEVVESASLNDLKSILELDKEIEDNEISDSEDDEKEKEDDTNEEEKSEEEIEKVKDAIDTVKDYVDSAEKKIEDKESSDSKEEKEEKSDEDESEESKEDEKVEEDETLDIIDDEEESSKNSTDTQQEESDEDESKEEKDENESDDDSDNKEDSEEKVEEDEDKSKEKSEEDKKDEESDEDESKEEKDENESDNDSDNKEDSEEDIDGTEVVIDDDETLDIIDDKESDDNKNSIDPEDIDNDGVEDSIEDDLETDDIIEEPEDYDNEVLKDLDKEEDVKKAVAVIRQRVADAEETFIKNNAKDKEQINDLLNKLSDNIKTVEELDKKDDSKETSIGTEESDRMIKRKISEMTNSRPLTIYEKVARYTNRNILRDSDQLDKYINESGSLDMNSVLETSKVIYGFLETLNTIQIIKVDEKYIKEFLENM